MAARSGVVLLCQGPDPQYVDKRPNMVRNAALLDAEFSARSERFMSDGSILPAMKEKACSQGTGTGPSSRRWQGIAQMRASTTIFEVATARYLPWIPLHGCSIARRRLSASLLASGAAPRAAGFWHRSSDRKMCPAGLADAAPACDIPAARRRAVMPIRARPARTRRAFSCTPRGGAWRGPLDPRTSSRTSCP